MLRDEQSGYSIANESTEIFQLKAKQIKENNKVG